MPSTGRPEASTNARQRRRARLVDAGRPAGQDVALRVERGEALRRRVPGDQLAVDVQLAHPPRDQLGGLRAVVEDGDGVVRQVLHLAIMTLIYLG